MNRPLLVVAGPTGTGKSALGMALAQQLGGEIICADSRQIYADMVIGTAQPDQTDLKLVPHHLFGQFSPRSQLTLAEYKPLAEAAIHDIQARGRVPILVGGTGLYLKSLLYDYQIPEVAPQPDLRAAFTLAEQMHGAGHLYAQLQACDPLAALKLHPGDLRRIIRALEVFQVTGQPISQAQTRSPSLRFNCIYLGLRMDKESLYRRLFSRIQDMFATGLSDELQQLRQEYGADLPLLQTLNYRETGDYLDGKCTLDEAQEAMLIHTRQFAKRQMTWFRKDEGLQWLDWPPLDMPQTVTQIIQQWQALS